MGCLWRSRSALRLQMWVAWAEGGEHRGLRWKILELSDRVKGLGLWLV